MRCGVVVKGHAERDPDGEEDEPRRDGGEHAPEVSTAARAAASGRHGHER
jgi:hypothetical protein